MKLTRIFESIIVFCVSIIHQIRLNKAAMASIRSSMLFSVMPWVCAAILPYRLSLRPFVLLGGSFKCLEQNSHIVTPDMLIT